MAAYCQVYDSTSPAGWLPKNWDQLRKPTLGNRVWATFTFLCTKLELYHDMLQRCKQWCKMKKMGWLVSVAMSPFNTVHMTSYSTSLETMRLCYIQYTIQRIIYRKSPILPSPPAFGTHIGVDPVRISRRSLASKKLESLGYHAALFAWSHIWPFWYNTGSWDRQTDGQTDRHMTTAWPELVQ